MASTDLAAHGPAPRPNAGTKGVPRAEREQQILAVASLAFGTDGFNATNVSEVAQDAGISKPLVYNYFGSKEGLYAACLDEAGALVGDEIEVRNAAASRQLVTKNLEENRARAVPGWLALNGEALKAAANRLPTREEMVPEINEQLIVEFYSRF